MIIGFFFRTLIACGKQLEPMLLALINFQQGSVDYRLNRERISSYRLRGIRPCAVKYIL